MAKSFLTIFIIFYSTFSFSQEKIYGIISDSLNKPIQYVNVGISNKPLGTVTNENGEFILILDNSMSLDTLKISCLGFKSTELYIKNLLINKSNINIFLENFIEKLDEVVINSNKLKVYSEGKDKIKTSNQVVFANPNYKNFNLGTEIGRKFSLGTKTPSILENFKFYIKDNNFEKVKFRINIYSINDNKPDKKIYNSNIIEEVNNKLTGWVSIDLTNFNIITQQDIIVTVEWIEGSKEGTTLNLPIILPSFGSVHYYKFGSQAKWEKYGNISSSMILTYKQ